jgi:hypothetical protein
MIRRRPIPRSPIARSIDWTKHAHALSWILDEQLADWAPKMSEREKCWRRSEFMNELHRIHGRAFRKLSDRTLRRKP